MSARRHFWSCAAWLLLGNIGASAAPTSNELGRLIVKNFAPRDFVGDAAVRQIAEDDDGLIYFGNGPGLVTYDGVTWRRLALEKPTDSIRAVVRAPDGRVYIGGDSLFGWLKPGAGLRRDFVSLVGDFPEAHRQFGWLENIAPHAGTLYLNVAKDFLRWRDGQGSLMPAAFLPWTHVLYGDTGPHFAYAPGGSFYRIEGEESFKVSDDPRLTSSAIRFTAHTREGALLVVQQSGDIWTVRGDRVEPWPHDEAAYLRGKKIARGWQLPDGSLALVLMGGGLVFLSPEGRFLTRLDESNGLRNHFVLSLKTARDGGIWLGLFNGAAHVEPPAGMTFFDSRDGLPTSSVRLLRRVGGRLYALTGEGVYGLKPGTGADAPARFERVLTSDHYALLPTARGFLVANADGGKVIEMTAAGPRTFPAPSVDSVRSHALLRSRQNPEFVWVSMENGIALLRETPAGWRDEGRVPGFAGHVRALAEAADGSMWGAMPGRGVCRIIPGHAADGQISVRTTTVEVLPTAPGKPAITGVADWGGEPVFTAADGERTVFRFNENTRSFEPFPGVPALPEGTQIAGAIFGADAADHLWLRRTFARNEEKVIYRVGRDGTVRALPQRVHDLIDNVLNFFEETGPDGPVLWLAGTDGVLRVNLNNAFAEPTPFSTFVWTQQGTASAGAVLAYNDNSLDFEFVAPRYSPTHPVLYQTRLVGDNADWSAWSPQRQRTFTHLREGEYRFEARARDVDGVLSQPAALAFKILPPWWRTWWARTGYVTVLGLIILGLVRLRTRALRRKNEQLEKTVATRTEDLRRQNGELARLHKLELDEKISARLMAEKAQLDVLRYQLNPHFLFNSLTSIRSQIPPTLGSARETIDRLADFCRLTLHGRKAEERTTVGEEIAMLRAYLDIEQTRMGELLSVEFDVDATLDETFIPRLLLLPLVENALKYGQATSDDLLRLKISAHRAATVEGAPALPEGGLVFEISNTGKWVERGSRPGIPSTGIGHDNLHERLRRHYPEAHWFTHEESAGWVRVRLTLSLFALSSAHSR